MECSGLDFSRKLVLKHDFLLNLTWINAGFKNVHCV